MEEVLGAADCGCWCCVDAKRMVDMNEEPRVALVAVAGEIR